MGIMSIGEFSKATRLSEKALRLYEELGLVVPTAREEATGAPTYDADQLGRARLVSQLRRVGLPLAEIRRLVEMEPTDAADSLAAYISRVEAEHAQRIHVAHAVVARLRGEPPDLGEAQLRQVGARTLLCWSRPADDDATVAALGKAFLALVREPAFPAGERAGADLLIYHGEVSADSDGPVEWCRPIEPGRADEVAAAYPELEVRVEPAHDEAVVELGSAAGLDTSSFEVAADGLVALVVSMGRSPSALGPRVGFLALEGNRTAPDCDFALPLA